MRLLSAKAAAEYCNYNYKHFRALKIYGRGPKYIPIEGSKMVAYEINDLDEWMRVCPKNTYIYKPSQQDTNKPINIWSRK